MGLNFFSLSTRVARRSRFALFATTTHHLIRKGVGSGSYFLLRNTDNLAGKVPTCTACILFSEAMTCVECDHPTCRHSINAVGVMRCPQENCKDHIYVHGMQAVYRIGVGFV